MDEIVKEFLLECCESLDRLDRDLVTLEKGSARKGDALLTRLNDGQAAQATIPLAPTTAPSTAVAVPALRSHAAVDPQTVAVVALSLLNCPPATPAASFPTTSAPVAGEEPSYNPRWFMASRH